MAQRTSKTIGFKAFEDSDADILEWWQAMPPGERSITLRALIRGALRPGSAKANGNGHSPELGQVAADTAWLKAALSELPTYLEGLLGRVQIVQTVPQAAVAEVPEDGQPRLDPEAVDRRRANMKRSSW